jgi:hypothetical protein
MFMGKKFSNNKSKVMGFTIIGLTILLFITIYKYHETNSLAKTQQEEINWQFMDGIKIARGNMEDYNLEKTSSSTAIMKNVAFYLGKASAVCKMTTYYKDNSSLANMLDKAYFLLTNEGSEKLLENREFIDLVHYLKILESNPANNDVTNEIINKELIKLEEKRLAFAGSDTVIVTTDRDFYIPAMSSVMGINMTPKFKTQKSYENLIYHWETTKGEFINLGKELKNEGASVIWRPMENDKALDTEEIIHIKLEVIDSKSKGILATTKLTITPVNGTYIIK